MSKPKPLLPPGGVSRWGGAGEYAQENRVERGKNVSSKASSHDARTWYEIVDNRFAAYDPLTGYNYGLKFTSIAMLPAVITSRLLMCIRRRRRGTGYVVPHRKPVPTERSMLRLMPRRLFRPTPSQGCF